MIKAGSAGSIPDGATKLKPVASQPLANLLQQLGDAIFSLNTAVIGLDAVENGYSRPANLDVSWCPKDAKIAARKSRKFILDAVLIRSAESIAEYIKALSKLPRHAPAGAAWNSDTSQAEKTRDMLKSILGKDNYLVQCTVLILHWRNRIVHPSSRASLTATEKTLLIKHEEEISEKYKRLSVTQLLAHFENNRATLKDVSSLISMTINTARLIDEASAICLSKDDLDAWLDHYGLTKKINKVRSEREATKNHLALERLFKSEAPNLLESYKHYYLNDM